MNPNSMNPGDLMIAAGMIIFIVLTAADFILTIRREARADARADRVAAEMEREIISEVAKIQSRRNREVMTMIDSKMSEVMEDIEGAVIRKHFRSENEKRKGKTKK